MLKKIFGLAPTLEPDGSYSPSKLALKMSTSQKTNYDNATYQAYTGARKKILILCTEQKNMPMKNGKQFSTGNHPVETFLPMMHLKSAGFEFTIVTPTGKPAILEMWAMPNGDQPVMDFYHEYKSQFENPGSLKDFVANSLAEHESYAAIYVPGGHGSMLGIPEDENVDKLLRWADQNDLYTITLCHGPGSLLATASNGQEFLYKGYEMAAFPDAVDKQTPMIGYLPGPMPWHLEAKLTELGAVIVNKKMDETTHIDRKLITGASPLASNELGKLSAKTLLANLT